MAPQKGFDYVIVGAGSAGCVLASRLTEDGTATALLIEAGGWDRDPWIHIPLGWGKILKERLHDWMYFSGPEEHVDGRQVECARGKIVGGSSSTNAMAFVRGNRGDYDRWAGSGLTDWSYAHALPYFRKLEHWEGGANGYRGGDGPLNTQFCRYEDPLLGAYAEAGRDAGHAWTEDYNGARQEGFGRLQMTIRNGRRHSSATAYLRPVLKRKNLTVTVKALVTRILFEGTRAVGIEYVQGGERLSVRAEREVILAGGVINSPQLLMLSGIGDPEELRRHGVAVKASLPGVGKNLQDHASVILMYRRKQPSPFLRAMRADRIARAIPQAYLLGTGFASDVPGGIVAFLRSQSGAKLPDIQILLTAASLGAFPYFPPVRAAFPDVFAARIVLLHPESRGFVGLQSSDPSAHPRIMQNLLSTDRDRRTLRDGVALTRALAAQPSMRPFVAGEFLPGDAKAGDSEIDAYMRATAITVHHPLGTCRMGVDADAVVGPDLKVLGTEALRVVDASVMPDLVSGNINAAVIMIAEKAADMIRGRPALDPAVIEPSP